MVFNHYYDNITFIVEWRRGATNRAMQCLHQKSIKVSISPPAAPCGCHQGRMKAQGKYTCPGYSPNLQPFVSQRSLRLGDAAVFLTTGYIFVFSSFPIPTPISISAIFPWHHYRREGGSGFAEMLLDSFFPWPGLPHPFHIRFPGILMHKGKMV